MVLGINVVYILTPNYNGTGNVNIGADLEILGRGFLTIAVVF